MLIPLITLPDIIFFDKLLMEEIEPLLSFMLDILEVLSPKAYEKGDRVDKSGMFAESKQCFTLLQD